MVRITKEADERRKEILDTAQNLCNLKGYDKTSINDIVNEIGIAKGTLYYYFKTKEEIFDAVIERYCERIISLVSEVADKKDLDAFQKLRLMLVQEQNLNKQNEQVLSHLHTWDNIKIHHKTFVYMIKHHTLVFEKVIRQGIEEGVFHTDYPLETVRILMTIPRTLFEQPYFSWSKDEIRRMIEAYQDIIECALKTKKGSFSFLKDMFSI